MKNFIIDFIHRGLLACGGGPVVLAIVYAILQRCGIVHTITVNEVISGILTSALLAFTAGGITTIYKVERLPLVPAIFIHAVILYLDYVIIYLANDWMKSPLIFTLCFVVGFIIVWAIVYICIKKSAERLNRKLAQYQGETGETMPQ